MQQSCANRFPAGHPAAGKLPVDWLDIHFYPQGNNVSGLSGDQSAEDDAATVAARLRSLKELYDPTWISESWIADGAIKVVQLIPRMRAWRDAYCPEMKLALAEYKWGRDDTLSGALAQAEALAIFGREGLDMALRWVAPESGSLAEDAYRLFRNYDGAGGQVSGDSVRAVSSDVDGVGSYAVRAANGKLFVLLFNKDTVARDVTVTVAGGATGSVGLWRLDGTGLADRRHARRHVHRLHRHAPRADRHPGARPARVGPDERDLRGRLRDRHDRDVGAVTPRGGRIRLRPEMVHPFRPISFRQERRCHECDDARPEWRGAEEDL